jgi:hypothetical protein
MGMERNPDGQVDWRLYLLIAAILLIVLAIVWPDFIAILTAALAQDGPDH